MFPEGEELLILYLAENVDVIEPNFLYITTVCYWSKLRVSVSKVVVPPAVSSPFHQKQVALSTHGTSHNKISFFPDKIGHFFSNMS